jgi:hypothetical protein
MLDQRDKAQLKGACLHKRDCLYFTSLIFSKIIRITKNYQQDHEASRDQKKIGIDICTLRGK